MLAEHLKSQKARGALLLGHATGHGHGRARSAGPAALTPTIVPELHERKIGPLSGLSREEGWEIYAESKRRWMAGDLEFTHEGGESFADIRRRVLPVVEDLRDRHPGQTIIVVAHGIVIRVLLLSLLDDIAAGRLRPHRHRLRLDQRPPLGRPSAGGPHALNQVVAPSPDRPVA